MLQSVRLDRDMIGSQVNALAGFAFQGALDPSVQTQGCCSEKGPTHAFPAANHV